MKISVPKLEVVQIETKIKEKIKPNLKTKIEIPNLKIVKKVENAPPNAYTLGKVENTAQHSEKRVENPVTKPKIP